MIGIGILSFFSRYYGLKWFRNPTTIYNRSSFDVLKVGQQKFHFKYRSAFWGHFNTYKLFAPQSNNQMPWGTTHKNCISWKNATHVTHNILSRRNTFVEQQKRNIRDNNTWCFMSTFSSIIIFNYSPKEHRYMQ